MIEWKSLLIKTTTALASVAIYLPIIAGIVTPMLYLLPAWYISWYIASLIFPFSGSWQGIIGTISDPSLVSVIWISKIGVFILGVLIFFCGIFEMARQLRMGNRLIDSGIYSYVRHPQHLGIILLTFPFTLPLELVARGSAGIRVGDILSWSLFAFLLLAVADYEESRLLTDLDGYAVSYAQYQTKTPFILPISLPIHIELPESLQSGKPARYAVAFLVYWGCISILLFGLIQLPLIFVDDINPFHMNHMNSYILSNRL